MKANRRIMRVEGGRTAVVVAGRTVLAHLAMRTRSTHGASPGAARAAGVRGGASPPASYLRRHVLLRLRGLLFPVG